MAAGVRRNQVKLGFSLLETMLAVGVSAVLANTLLPPLIDAINDSRLRAEAYGLYAVLNTARMTAIVRNQPIVVCRATVDKAGATHCGGIDRRWTQGLIAYSNSNPNRDFQSGADVPVGSPLTFRQHTEVDLEAPCDSITFLPDGRVNTAETIKFEIRDQRGPTSARRVSLSPRGQLTLSRAL
jgi:Tfp pilus assembly protein FimT